MKRHLTFSIFILSVVNFFPLLTFAQLVLLLSDDFESYAPYQVCNNYTTDIQVYPTHGTVSSQGLRAFMNSFDSKDSLITGWIAPLNTPAVIEFDFRIMEASALYPFIPATLNAGDQFSLSYSTDGQQYNNLATWDASNFTTVTTFTQVSLPVPLCDSARFKFLVKRINNPTDYFVDIDNLLIYSGTNSISENDESNLLSAGPNPFNNELLIRANNHTSEYELLDLGGRIIHSGTISTKNELLNTSDLPQGNYFLRIKENDESSIIRLVKTK
jgi:hypothetical protein